MSSKKIYTELKLGVTFIRDCIFIVSSWINFIILVRRRDTKSFHKNNNNNNEKPSQEDPKRQATQTDRSTASVGWPLARKDGSRQWNCDAAGIAK